MRFIIRSVLALLLIALAALTIWLLFAPRYDYEVVFDFPTNEGYARGSAFVGVGSPGEEVEIECPLGIVALEGSQLALIDTSTRRILTLDTAQRSIIGTTSIDLDPSLFPTSAVYDDQTLFLWTSDSTAEVQMPVALVFSEGAWLSRGTRRLQRGERAYDLFRDRGLSQKLPPEFLTRDRSIDPPATVAVARYTREPSYTWREAIPGSPRAGDRLNFQLTDRWLTVDTLAPDGSTRFMTVKAPREILTAAALGTGATDEAYFTVQNWNPRSLDVVVREEVYRTDQPDAVYDVPLSEGDCIPTLQSAVTKFGGIYSLRVTEQAVSLLRLKQRSLANQIRAMLSEEGFELPRFNWKAITGVSTADAQALQTGNRIDRETVLNNACAYLKEKWTWTEKSAMAPPGSVTCRALPPWEAVGFTPAKPEKRRINDVETTVRVNGRTETGLPYLWGGGDTLATFRTKIQQQKTAGNICTSRKCNPINKNECTKTDTVNVAGVDCSGFITRILGYKETKKFGTSDLADPDKSIRVTLTQMQPGDIVNKAGSHVMMFLAYRKSTGQKPSEKLEVIEARFQGVQKVEYEMKQVTIANSTWQQLLVRDGERDRYGIRAEREYQFRRPVVIRDGALPSQAAMECSNVP